MTSKSSSLNVIMKNFVMAFCTPPFPSPFAPLRRPDISSYIDERLYKISKSIVLFKNMFSNFHHVSFALGFKVMMYVKLKRFKMSKQ